MRYIGNKVLIIGLFCLCTFLMACNQKETADNPNDKQKAAFELDHEWSTDSIPGDSAMVVMKGKIRIRIENYEQSPLRYGIADIEAHTQRLNYYLTGAPVDIQLLIDGEAMPMASYIFEHNQNLTDHETMLFSFLVPRDKYENSKKITLSYIDRVFLTGINNFNLK